MNFFQSVTVYSSPDMDSYEVYAGTEIPDIVQIPESESYSDLN